MKYKITLNGKCYEVVVEKGQAVIENEYEAVAAPVAAAAAPAKSQWWFFPQPALQNPIVFQYSIVPFPTVFCKSCWNLQIPGISRIISPSETMGGDDNV